MCLETGMEELTMLLLVACLVSGGAVMILRKVNPSAFIFSLVMSVLAIGAIASDQSLLEAEGFELTLCIVAPFVVMIYSIWGWLFGGDGK